MEDEVFSSTCKRFYSTLWRTKVKRKLVSTSLSVQSRYERLRSYDLDCIVTGYLLDVEICVCHVVGKVYDSRHTGDGCQIFPAQIVGIHKYQRGLWCIETDSDYYAVVSFKPKGRVSLDFYLSLIESVRLLPSSNKCH